MTSKELRQLAIDIDTKKVCLFSYGPECISYEYWDKATSRGFFYSNISLNKDDSKKVIEFVDKYRSLKEQFLYSK